MKITIKVTPKEIADIASELQSQLETKKKSEEMTKVFNQKIYQALQDTDTYFLDE